MPKAVGPASRRTLLARGSWSEDSRITDLLRKETVGGALLAVATLLALVWANSPWGDAYARLRDAVVGPSLLHLDLTVGTWAAAVLFVAVNVTTGGGALRGWAIPTATDIAFALAVLAVISTHLPTGLRTFLSRWPSSMTCSRWRSSRSSTPPT
jgi:NhaA family Na+:H+ antiporter